MSLGDVVLVSCDQVKVSITINDAMCLLSDVEEEDEEEFLESLPTDMMEDDDLEEIRAMAQKASFLTRDLSSW